MNTTTFKDQLNPLLDDVAQQIIDLVRESVLATVTAGLGSTSPSVVVSAPTSAAAKPKPVVSAPEASKSKRIRRSKADLAKDDDNILAILKKEQGLKISGICERLGIDAEEKAKIGHSLGRLLEQGRVKKDGDRNTAKYSTAA